jgi:hypothetical protein
MGQKNGNKLEYIGRPSDTSAALALYQQYWTAKSPDVDVSLVDVIWQGIAAPHAVERQRQSRRLPRRMATDAFGLLQGT